MRTGVRIGIVTAAGYVESSRYYGRLHGLLDAIAASDMTESQKKNLIVLGGESSYLFQFDGSKPDRLVQVPREAWALEEMRSWTNEDIAQLLDLAESALRSCVDSMRLKADILRKERAVGIIPSAGFKLSREQLEETVLVCQKILVRPGRILVSSSETDNSQEMSDVGRRLPFCAFNGEVWKHYISRSIG
jgi:IMP and pyridine-specific 5'-nucleotidase